LSRSHLSLNRWPLVQQRLDARVAEKSRKGP
jgi:hypothetical protein